MDGERRTLSWAGAILAALAALYLYMLACGLLERIGARVAAGQ